MRSGLVMAAIIELYFHPLSFREEHRDGRRNVRGVTVPGVEGVGEDEMGN